MNNFRSCSTTTFGHLHSVKLTSLLKVAIECIAEKSFKCKKVDLILKVQFDMVKLTLSKK